MEKAQEEDGPADWFMDYFYNMLIRFEFGVYGDPDEEMIDKKIRYFGQHGIGENQYKAGAQVVLAELVQRVDDLALDNFLYGIEVHRVISAQVK